MRQLLTPILSKISENIYDILPPQIQHLSLYSYKANEILTDTAKIRETIANITVLLDKIDHIVKTEEEPKLFTE